MSIQRYSPEAGYSEPMEIDSLGKWVKHKDHLKAMEAKQSEFNGLSKHFKKLNQDCEKLQKELLNRMHEIDAKAAQLAEKDREIERLKFMVDNGLGWEDVKNDATEHVELI